MKLNEKVARYKPTNFAQIKFLIKSLVALQLKFETKKVAFSVFS